MENEKKELVDMMNEALKLEHAARIQYLAHAELIKGLEAEKIIERLREIAGDEEKHEQKFRNMIGGYLNGEPTMAMGATQGAHTTDEILKTNLKNEQAAIDFYKTIYQKAVEYRKTLPYIFETLEHELRHIIVDEQEHMTELSLLLGK